MTLQTEAEKRADKTYHQKMKDSGYRRLQIWVKDGWKEKIAEFVKELKGE